MSEQQTEQQLREEVSNEVFNGVAANTPSPEQTQETKPEVVATEKAAADKPAETVDEWAGVSPGLRKTVEGMKQQLGEFEGLKGRVKQTESRLGRFIDEQKNAAAHAAKAVTHAPTTAQIDAAAGTADRWKKLEEIFPEWAEEYKAYSAEQEKKFGEKFDDLLTKIPKTDDLKTDIASLKAESERIRDAVISSTHRGWKNTINTKEFVEWFTTNKKADSEDPDAVITLLDEYATHQKARKVTSSTVKEREDRLAQHETVTGKRLPPTKSEADMTDKELRASVAKEVYGTA